MEEVHPSQMSAQTLSTQYEHPTQNLHLHINFYLECKLLNFALHMHQPGCSRSPSEHYYCNTNTKFNISVFTMMLKFNLQFTALMDNFAILYISTLLGMNVHDQSKPMGTLLPLSLKRARTRTHTHTHKKSKCTFLLNTHIKPNHKRVSHIFPLQTENLKSTHTL